MRRAEALLFQFLFLKGGTMTKKKPAASTAPPEEFVEPDKSGMFTEMSELGLAGVLGRRMLQIVRNMLDGEDLPTSTLDDKTHKILATAVDILHIFDFLNACGFWRPAQRTVRGQACPPATQQRLAEYWQDHVRPPPFLLAVLSNDLVAAVQLANDEELRCLCAIVDAVQAVPESLRGSVERVRAFLAGQGAQ
jgi:hypothetical protein